jgi:uncharacterized protein (TIGR00730 family)
MSRSGKIINVCVYCGSGTGRNPVYAQAAQTLGVSLASAGMNLIYGGGSHGLMGLVARAAKSAGGKVTGIIPRDLMARERPDVTLHELIITDNLHQRKMAMFDRADAFVALPGGIGTLEELVEQLTWGQLDLHTKPTVIVNVNDYWRPLLVLLEQMRSQRFIRQGLTPRFEVVSEAADVVPLLRGVPTGYAVPEMDKFV